MKFGFLQDFISQQVTLKKQDSVDITMVHGYTDLFVYDFMPEAPYAQLFRFKEGERKPIVIFEWLDEDLVMQKLAAVGEWQEIRKHLQFSAGRKEKYGEKRPW